MKKREISLKPDIDILEPIKTFIQFRLDFILSTVSGMYLVIIIELIKDTNIK